jgi:GTP:adenosylcobinamide-phosphate guanylyltransferase
MTADVRIANVTALILAASRRGPADPVAQVQGLSHKCLVAIAGTPMIARVVDAVRATPDIGRIFVSIEDPGVVASAGLGDVTIISSRATLADSVAAAIAEMERTGHAPFPLLITTADNALHTPAIVGAFCAASAATDADATVGMTPAATVLATYPTGQRAFHHFRDGDYSGCNIYMLRTSAAAHAVRAFSGGGQFGKKPWRVIAAFGLGMFMLHILRRLTLDAAFRRISKALGASIAPVILPFAEAPIDVDSAADYALASEIIRARAPLTS